MAMTSSNGGGSNNDGDAASRMGMLQVNDLQYKLEPDMSVATQRTHTTQFFQNPAYTWSQTAIAVLNSGAYYIDPRRSFLTFNVILNDLVLPTPGSLASRTWFQALYFGQHGSVLNLIDSVVVTTRSGDEISRVNDFGSMHNVLLPLMYGKEYLDSLGDSMGYGSYVGSSNNAAGVPNPAGGVFPQAFSEHYRRKFTIPLCMLSPVFNYGRLLPSMLMSGLRIEIKWKEILGCGIQFLENVPREAPLSFNGGEGRDQSFAVTMLAKRAANGAYLADSGINVGWANGGVVTYDSGLQTIQIAGINLLAAVDEGFERGIRRPFEAGEVIQVREGFNNIYHDFEVMEIVNATTLRVTPLLSAHFLPQASIFAPAASFTIFNSAVTFSSPHRASTAVISFRDALGVTRPLSDVDGTAGFSPVPNVAAGALMLGGGFFRSRVPSFTLAGLDAGGGIWAALYVFRRRKVPGPVSFQRYFSGTEAQALGGTQALAFPIMTGYGIGDIELSLASTQLSDAVQRTLNEYSAANGLEIVFADYDRTSAPILQGVNAQMIYCEVRKSASRALAAFARICPAPDDTSRPYVDTMASVVGSYWNHYQWQLGSLYFPQQRVASKDNDLVLRADGTLALAYNYTMDAFDRFHPKAAPTAISLRGSSIDWNVIDRHPLRSIREHRPERLFYPVGPRTMGKWGSFVNGATTLACTLERSSLFDLSGIPINNSRVLALRAEYVNNDAFPAVLMIYLKYVKVCRVFLLNAEIEQ